MMDEKILTRDMRLGLVFRDLVTVRQTDAKERSYVVWKCVCLRCGETEYTFLLTGFYSEMAAVAAILKRNAINASEKPCILFFCCGRFLTNYVFNAVETKPRPT